ncbi:hypothetical protein V501_04806 [Pseudogymnoascus sp. VKM F-4519 (FW-2642)]|nr:hypothetical protein V501_04806 [Pseudogymnoascus sp. VKM F-4519 (FW-2642)]
MFFTAVSCAGVGMGWDGMGSMQVQLCQRARFSHHTSPVSKRQPNNPPFNHQTRILEDLLLAARGSKEATQRERSNRETGLQLAQDSTQVQSGKQLDLGSRFEDEDAERQLPATDGHLLALLLLLLLLQNAVTAWGVAVVSNPAVVTATASRSGTK